MYFLGFEQSPFKLTPEFVEVMGGPTSALWSEFQILLLKGLMAARKHMDRVINLVEIMRSSKCIVLFSYFLSVFNLHLGSIFFFSFLHIFWSLLS